METRGKLDDGLEKDTNLQTKKLTEPQTGPINNESSCPETS